MEWVIMMNGKRKYGDKDMEKRKGWMIGKVLVFCVLKSKFVKRFFMEEIIFTVEESPEGGFTAKGLGNSIYTQADDYETLKLSVIDAVHCHFDDTKKRIIRLRIVKEEVIAA